MYYSNFRLRPSSASTRKRQPRESPRPSPDSIIVRFDAMHTVIAMGYPRTRTDWRLMGACCSHRYRERHEVDCRLRRLTRAKLIHTTLRQPPYYPYRPAGCSASLFCWRSLSTRTSPILRPCAQPKPVRARAILAMLRSLRPTTSTVATQRKAAEMSSAAPAFTILPGAIHHATTGAGSWPASSPSLAHPSTAATRHSSNPLRRRDWRRGCGCPRLLFSNSTTRTARI
ncbi:hypothetical protein FB451DRAFT_158096 [Mycena latifolia]|nr:hypothetical protein FB451DRAFT_158096 [Mycena latifolia]